MANNYLEQLAAEGREAVGPSCHGRGMRNVRGSPARSLRQH